MLLFKNVCIMKRSIMIILKIISVNFENSEFRRLQIVIIAIVNIHDLLQIY